jgi:predicted phage terminase large subunit-like protein
LSGVKKYFIIEGDNFVFVDSDYVTEDGLMPKSITYISADIWDNPKLLNINPDYITSLRSLPLIERERFLGIKGRGGNWNIKAEAGKVFQAHWFIKVPPIQLQPGDKAVRFWDFAASHSTVRRADYTVGVLMIKRGDRYFIVDLQRYRLPPTQANTLVLNTAKSDGVNVSVRWQCEPGAAGVRDSATIQQLLAGYDARSVTELRDKVSRAMPLSAAIESSSVVLCNSGFNQLLISELEQFPDGEHDDIVDGLTGCYNCLTGVSTNISNFKY